MMSKILCLRRCYEHRMSAQWCPCAAHGKTAAFGIVALFGPQVIMFSVLRFERSPFTCTLWAFLIMTYSFWSGRSCSLQRERRCRLTHTTALWEIHHLTSTAFENTPL